MSEEKTETRIMSSAFFPCKLVQWDVSVNSDKFDYSANNTTAKLVGSSSTIRTNFFECGRHVIKIKLNNCGNTGIGLVTKSFKSDTWIGSDSAGTSWGIYNAYGGYYYKGSKLKTDRSITLKGNDIITVDLNMDKNTVNWAINGIFLSNDNIPSLTKSHLAVAASLWTKSDSVQIVQYDIM
eukprot:112157_1